jgi:hypothetical protein
MFECMAHRTDVRYGFERRQQCCVELFGSGHEAMTKLDPDFSAGGTRTRSAAENENTSLHTSSSTRL